MRYKIQCMYNDVNWKDGWAATGLAKYVKPLSNSSYTNIGEFETNDINFAFRYQNYLTDYYGSRKIIYEVREI